MKHIKYFESESRERSWKRIDRSQWYDLRTNFRIVDFSQIEIDRIKSNLDDKLTFNFDSKAIGIYHKRKCFLTLNKLENGKILVYDHLKMSGGSKYVCRDIDGLLKWMNMNLNTINIYESFDREKLIKNSKKIQDKFDSLEKNIDKMLDYLISNGNKLTNKEIVLYLQKEREKIEAKWEEIKR